MGKTIFVVGADGYIGNALTQRLLKKGNKVIGFDNFWRRTWIKEEMKSISALPINSMESKEIYFKKMGNFGFMELDVALDPKMFDQFVREYQPDVIYNLAHNPSAPYSMASRENANKVLFNNMIGTNNILWSIKNNCPDCHFVTIGTVGEFDHYNNIDIEEGFFEIEYKGRKSTKLMYPRRPTSIYHTSKTGSTYLIDYLARAWNLKCTDVMQGIVFGAYTDEINKTKVHSRFDFDEAGGTVLNRFCVQAILGIPLTIYGKGKHKRSFLSLNDSVQALMIALENPAKKGEVQTWNQLSEWHSMNNIAYMVIDACSELGIYVDLQHIKTPRMEKTDDHYYNFITKNLTSKGYVPTRTIKEEIKYCIKKLKRNKNNIERCKSVVLPKINFRQ